MGVVEAKLRGHTEAWESLTTTQGATLKHGSFGAACVFQVKDSHNMV